MNLQHNQTTQAATIKLIQEATTEQALRIATQKAGLVKLDADTDAVNAAIKKMSAEIVNMAAGREIEWMKIDQNERERLVREKLLKLQTEQTEFNDELPDVFLGIQNSGSVTVEMELGGQGTSSDLSWEDIVSTYENLS